MAVVVCTDCGHFVNGCGRGGGGACVHGSCAFSLLIKVEF